MMHALYPYVLYLGLPLTALAAYWYWFYYKNPVYFFSSLAPLRAQIAAVHWRRPVLFFTRLALLTALCAALARFQAPDERSKIPVQGVDIMLVLDASESMDIFDDPSDKKTRMDAARQEALKFIDKRENDPIGLVIFAGAAVSRCPLTLDKHMLKQMLNETTTSTIKVPGTALSRAILTAANRLKKSTAQSRIMIVLTDGEPHNDISPDLAIEMAKKLGIKIYTIGVGADTGYYNHPLYGTVPVQTGLNIPLLEKFASQTGGKFFLARNAADMEAIYNAIDKLEKTEHEAPIFARYFEYFMPLLWIAFLLLLIEIILATIWWVRL